MVQVTHGLSLLLVGCPVIAALSHSLRRHASSECPANSEGKFPDCECEAGFAGELVWDDYAKDWTGSCKRLPEVKKFQLVDAVNCEPIAGFTRLTNDSTLCVDELPRFSVVAVANSKTESVEFLLDDKHVRVENYVPYSLQGDSEGHCRMWQPERGMHVVKAVPYSEDHRQGIEGVALSVSLHVRQCSPPVIKKFFLADGHCRAIDGFDPLTSGDMLCLNMLPSKFTIIAAANDITESVAFFLNGKEVQLENHALYTLRGNSGSDCHSWDAHAGENRVKAIPYSEDGKQGTQGAAFDLTLNVREQCVMPHDD